MPSRIQLATLPAFTVLPAEVSPPSRFAPPTVTALKRGRLPELQVPLSTIWKVTVAPWAGTAAVPGLITLVG